MSNNLLQSGLLRFDEPNFYGSIWTTSVDTQYLKYKDIYDWQKRLTQIGRTRYMEDGLALQID